MTDFNETKGVPRHCTLEDWPVEPFELPPCIAGVLVFDLVDDAEFTLRDQPKRIQLTPPFSALIPKLQPWTNSELRARNRRKHATQVFLGSPLVLDTNRVAPTRLASSDKRWFAC